jgi:hypothetical protein
MVVRHGILELLYGDAFVERSREEIVEGMVDIFLNGIVSNKER